jgi:succinate dehydrogenase/fumarate reductase flavoprotein subunit
MSTRTAEDYLEADVLVLGGGLAGCFAAIKAANKGASVVLFDKAHIKRSGNGGTGLHRIPLVHPDYNYSFEEFAKLNVDCAAGICDEDLSYAFAEDSLDRILDLESFGIKVRRDDGSFIFKPGQDIAPGKIAIWGPGADVWHDIKPVLAKKVRESGVKVLNRTAAVGLLTEDGASGGRVVGGLGMGTRTAGFVVCSAKAVVVTTGGSYRVGRHKDSLYAPTRFIECGCPTNSGDGQHMAYRAGAEIVNMEFLEMSPSWKDFSHWGCGPIGVVGRELLGTGEPVSTSHEESSKLDRYSKTYLFGRDTEALFNDASQIPGYPEVKGEMLELLQAEENEATSAGYLLWQKMRGEDFTKAPIEFEWHPPYLHNNQAGIYINTQAASSLEGLYCAGDVIGGGWRQSSGGAFVFGARAGSNAADYALDSEQGEISPAQVAEEKKPFLRATEAAPEKGYSWIELEDKARQIITEYGSPFTSDAKLTRGMEHLERIQKQYLPLIYARNAREMLRVSEVHSTFWIAKAHLTCALARKESRSPYVSVFYKRGYPGEDNENWRKHSVIRNEDGQMIHGTQEVRRLQ